jgi:hypothetical protein
MNDPERPPAWQSEKQPLSWRGAIGMLLAFRYAIRQQRKQDAPESVILNDRASRVVNKAEELARAGRLDEDAVAEVRRAAGRHRLAMTDALLHFKARGEHLEWRHYNEAVRLLEAAINRTPVAPEDPAATPRLDALQRLASLDRDAAFAELAALEPGLAALRDEVAALPVRPWPRTHEEIRAALPAQQALTKRLRPLVGGERPDHDPILGSVTAYGICVGLLQRLGYSGEPPSFQGFRPFAS